jgi:hypothetical protein
MRTIRLAIVLSTALVLVASGPVAAGDARPMTGRFSATVQPVAQRCGSDALTIGFEISGVASHLGRLTGTGTNCTEPTLATEAVAVWDGEATLTAADGSTITTVASGTQDAPVNGIATFAIEHTVTGGSGRLADATGVWSLTGTINFLTGEVEGTVDGWLSY